MTMKLRQVVILIHITQTRIGHSDCNLLFVSDKKSGLDFKCSEKNKEPERD